MRIHLKMKILEMYGSQANFARKCGQSDNWISRIVTGRQAPNEEEKGIIAKLLRVKNTDGYLGDSIKDF